MKVWRKAFNILLAAVLVAGLFPCLAWGEPSQVDSSEGDAAETSAPRIFGDSVSVGDNHSAVVKEEGSS